MKHTHISHGADFHRPDRIHSPLYVITPVFNSPRWRSRWKLYKDFEKYVLSSNEAFLITVECTFGERDKVFVTQEGPKHIIVHVQTEHEIWLKENLINLGIQNIPHSDWKYVAWIDSDVQFARPDWVGETLHLLQRHSFLQMFSQAIDLSPSYEILKTHTGFVSCYKNGVPNMNKNAQIPLPYYYGDGPNGAYWHPGFAWAARKSAINHVGGLIDWSVLGGGDMFMAYALVGQLKGKLMPASLGQVGVRWLSEWQNRCERHIKRNVGFMEGLLIHYWHGKKQDRRYNDRGQILISSKFNPELDLKKDWQGLWQLTDRSFELRDGVREYFMRRNEDSVDV